MVDTFPQHFMADWNNPCGMSESSDGGQISGSWEMERESWPGLQ